jgi:hypothetical protein
MVLVAGWYTRIEEKWIASFGLMKSTPAQTAPIRQWQHRHALFAYRTAKLLME